MTAELHIPEIDVRPPDALRAEIQAMAAMGSQIVIRNDEELAVAYDYRSGAKLLIAKITGFFKPIKQSIDATKKTVLDAEKKELSVPEAVVNTCDRAIKVYLDEREQREREERERLERQLREERERQVRAAQEQARREAEERAAAAKREAEERARIEQEQALARAAELEASGRVDEAMNLINSTVDAVEEIAQQGAEEASAAIAEGQQIVDEIAAVPVFAPRVEMPTGLNVPSGKRRAADREHFDKAKVITFVAAEIARGNFAFVGWLDMAWKNVDASVRQMEGLFPSADVCGIAAVEDRIIRSARK